MMTLNLKHGLALVLCTLIPLFGCTKSSDGGSTPGNPVLQLEILSWNETSVTLRAKTLQATHVRLLCLAADANEPTDSEVYEKGSIYADESFTIEGLEPLTEYTVHAVACDDAGAFGNVQRVTFRTEYSDPKPYEWESARGGILAYTDMVLCYGGSSHRTPFEWTAERFAPMVSYTDPEGREHWLFDAFLCIEFRMGDYSINLGQYLESGTRKQWEELLDYWLADPETGVGALENAVAAAAERLGAPAEKRKVVMVIPDPIIYEYYSDTSTPTNYWGEVNGRKMDFADDRDRVTAMEWYINEVRRHFDQAGYRYIELAGFYIVSEDLATPDDGWNPELKRWENVIPPVAEYLHGLNESLNWIPYNRAAGYTHWKEMGIDYAYMQPNIFWGKHPDYTWERFFADIQANGLAMELEFDEALLGSAAESETYRTRLREYMQGAIDNGVYDSKPLAYYQGTNAFYDLSVSENPLDKELYHEFCQFVINHPLRTLQNSNN